MFHFGKINGIPYQMLSSENKQHLENIVEANVKYEPTMHCQERSFVRLPGYVDVEVYSTNSLDSLREEPLRLAATVCKLKPAPEQYVQQFEALRMSQRDGVFVKIESLVQTLKSTSESAPCGSGEVEISQL